MIIISDDSSLILLENISLMEHITKNNKIRIPEEVYHEAIIKGKERKYPDAFELDNKVKKGIIKKIQIKDKKKYNEIKENFNLAEGETEAIVLYHEGKGDLIALDDLKAMRYCNYYNIPFTTTVAFVLNYCNEKIINKKEAMKMIKNLGTYGRYKDEIIFYALKQIGGQ